MSKNESDLAIRKIYELVKKNPRKYGILLNILKQISNNKKSNSLGYKRVFNSEE